MSRSIAMSTFVLTAVAASRGNADDCGLSAGSAQSQPVYVAAPAYAATPVYSYTAPVYSSPVLYAPTVPVTGTQEVPSLQDSFLGDLVLKLVDRLITGDEGTGDGGSGTGELGQRVAEIESELKDLKATVDGIGMLVAELNDRVTALEEN